MANIIDSYPESNYANNGSIYSSFPADGQSFTVSVADHKLNSCKFYLEKIGSPTGNAVAKLYSHSGTYGSSSVPNSSLATSGTFDVSTLSAVSYQLITFTFTGVNKVLLANATYYCIVVEYSGGDINNRVSVGLDDTSPSHSGNRFYYGAGTWNVSASHDDIFYVYADPPVASNIIMF